MRKTYLDCLPRAVTQQLWKDKLSACGYFTDRVIEEIDIDKVLGRVTATSIYAQQSVPHYNAAAMDGIAVWAQDTFGANETRPIRLNLLAQAEAFSANGCYIVDTGDLLPVGTNAVIMIEDVRIEDAQVEIMAAAVPWQHVRLFGEDIVERDMVFPEEHVITAPDIAALLAAGLDKVAVIAKPIVTIIPTGSELVASRHELAPGKILDVNSHMLAAAVTGWGAIPRRHPIVPDDYDQLYQAVKNSLAVSDMVITNAGTSAGTEDFTEKVLRDLGEVVAHGVAIKPGKPVVIAVCQGKPVIGLPGYPVSAMLTAELFVRDVLCVRQRLPQPAACRIKAYMARQIYSNAGVEEYVRVSVGSIQGRTVAAPLSRGAGLISSLTKAHGSIVISEESDGLAAGTAIDVILSRRNDSTNSLLAVGSHDMALEILGVYLKRRLHTELACANVGSMGGIMAIRNDEAHIAGVHILDEATGQFNLPYIYRYLAGHPCVVVHLAKREQGLMVAKRNPHNITGLADLVRPEISYVNRQRGSGTRMLLDYELKKLAISAGNICGYEREVATHMAVAATIASGTADAGMGIRAAARALGLDFIPVNEEQYDLVLNFSADDELVTVITQILESNEFRREVAALGGYDLDGAGNILFAQ